MPGNRLDDVLNPTVRTMCCTIGRPYERQLELADHLKETMCRTRIRVDQNWPASNGIPSSLSRAMKVLGMSEPGSWSGRCLESGPAPGFRRRPLHEEMLHFKLNLSVRTPDQIDLPGCRFVRGTVPEGIGIRQKWTWSQISVLRSIGQWDLLAVAWEYFALRVVKHGPAGVISVHGIDVSRPGFRGRL